MGDSFALLANITEQLIAEDGSCLRWWSLELRLWIVRFILLWRRWIAWLRLWCRVGKSGKAKRALLHNRLARWLRSWRGWWISRLLLYRLLDWRRLWQARKTKGPLLFDRLADWLRENRSISGILLISRFNRLDRLNGLS